MRVGCHKAASLATLQTPAFSLAMWLTFSLSLAFLLCDAFHHEVLARSQFDTMILDLQDYYILSFFIKYPTSGILLLQPEWTETPNHLHSIIITDNTDPGDLQTIFWGTVFSWTLFLFHRWTTSLSSKTQISLCLDKPVCYFFTCVCVCVCVCEQPWTSLKKRWITEYI
jgi:hypothetical protein